MVLMRWCTFSSLKITSPISPWKWNCSLWIEINLFRWIRLFWILWIKSTVKILNTGCLPSSYQSTLPKALWLKPLVIWIINSCLNLRRGTVATHRHKPSYEQKSLWGLWRSRGNFVPCGHVVVRQCSFVKRFWQMLKDLTAGPYIAWRKPHWAPNLKDP